MLGPECSYGKACKAVINVLQRKYELFYKMGAQFGPSYGHEILYQLHLVAIEFFGSTTTEDEYEAGMPHPDTKTNWLLNAIYSQQLSNSKGRPPMFGTTAVKTQTNTSTQTQHTGNKTAPNTARNQNKPATNRTK